MKKRKLALHWQILIAIVLAIVYGLIFPNKYVLTEDFYEILTKESQQKVLSREDSKKKFSDLELIGIKQLVNNQPVNKIKFLENLSVVTKDTLSNDTLSKGTLSKDQTDYICDKTVYNPEVGYVSWMGELFLRALRMIIIPLILTSIISGISNIGTASNLGRLGLKTMLYYLTTSTLAIIAGLTFVNLIKPGNGIDPDLLKGAEEMDFEKTSFSETLMNIVPENIFEAFANQQMLPVIFFAILFGFFITRVNNHSRITMTDFFNSAFEVMMKLTLFIIMFTPFGVFGIIADTIASNAGSLASLAESLGLYSITVLAALTFHALIVLPLFLKFVAKAHPWRHFIAMRSALLTAFSTSSSGATLSLTMESVKNKSGVSNKIAGFTLPLGATINMDGTALYECVAALFIAQAYGYDLTMIEQIIIVVTALLASIGAASIPMAGLVMLSVVLSAVDLPLIGIALILPVDRILDMFRTSVNVWSDSCGAVTVAKTEGEELKV